MLDVNMQFMHIGSMTLSEYLASHKNQDGTVGLSDAAFGEMIEMSQSQVNRMKNGVSRPSWKTIELIRVKTNGKVKPNDWFKSVEAA